MDAKLGFKNRPSSSKDTKFVSQKAFQNHKIKVEDEKILCDEHVTSIIYQPRLIAIRWFSRTAQEGTSSEDVGFSRRLISMSLMTH